jgi:hypothetical protein
MPTFLLCAEFDTSGRELERYSKTMSESEMAVYFTKAERKALANGKTVVQPNDVRDIFTHFADMTAAF